MPRFGDSWVVDRTMFEYVNGGSCACCGLSHLFSPDGLKGLIDLCTDLETDAADNELQAAERSVWPPQLREQVWADRVRLRTKMKMEMREFKGFFGRWGREEVERWCLTQLHHSDNNTTTDTNDTTVEEGNEKQAVEEALRRLFQMPRNEIGTILRSKYNIHSAYAVVLCAVAEQVANFPLTALETDGRGEEEVAFEKYLGYDRRGGFVLPIASSSSSDGGCAEGGEGPTRTPSSSGLFRGGSSSRRNLSTPKPPPKTPEQVVSLFLDFMVKLGGPKLLEREVKSEDDNDDDEGGADEAPTKKKPTGTGPSFRSDRRMVRLLIARYWARRIMDKFEASHAPPPKEDEENKQQEGEKEGAEEEEEENEAEEKKQEGETTEEEEKEMERQ